MHLCIATSICLRPDYTILWFYTSSAMLHAEHELVRSAVGSCTSSQHMTSVLMKWWELQRTRRCYWSVRSLKDDSVFKNRMQWNCTVLSDPSSRDLFMPWIMKNWHSNNEVTTACFLFAFDRLTKNSLIRSWSWLKVGRKKGQSWSVVVLPLKTEACL